MQIVFKVFAVRVDNFACSDSPLDYCNSLLARIPSKLVNKVQRVMNCAARLVCKAPKTIGLRTMKI